MTGLDVSRREKKLWMVNYRQVIPQQVCRQQHWAGTTIADCLYIGYWRNWESARTMLEPSFTKIWVSARFPFFAALIIQLAEGNTNAWFSRLYLHMWPKPNLSANHLNRRWELVLPVRFWVKTANNGVPTNFSLLQKKIAYRILESRHSWLHFQMALFKKQFFQIRQTVNAKFYKTVWKHLFLGTQRVHSQNTRVESGVCCMTMHAYCDLCTQYHGPTSCNCYHASTVLT